MTCPWDVQLPLTKDEDPGVYQVNLCQDENRYPRRAGWYLLLLILLTSILYFRDLNVRALRSDEAIYARVVDIMLQTGDWIRLSYLTDKPPLYFWLTGWTYPLFDGGPLAYRFWSALFGTGCVLLTFVLGWRWFHPEVGLLASLLLLTNKSFGFSWGARMGCFDTTITFLFLLSILIYFHIDRWRWPSLGWALIGLCLAGICLLKAFAGFPFLLLFTCHRLIDRRQESFWQRVRGPMVALVSCCLGTGPWYLLRFMGEGQAFFLSFVWVNLVQRGVAGVDPWHIRGPWFYLENITGSSPGFVFFLPSILFGLFLAYRGIWRRELSFVAGFAAITVTLLSLPKSKLAHYAYPVYPLIALTISACLLVLLRQLATRVRRVPRNVFLGSCLTILVLALGARWTRLAFVVVPEMSIPYGPMLVYKHVRPQLERGECRLIFYRFQKPDAPPDQERGFADIDVYYLNQMPLARWIEKAEELERVLAEGLPTYVFAREEEASKVAGLHRARRLPLKGEKGIALLSLHEKQTRLGYLGR